MGGGGWWGVGGVGGGGGAHRPSVKRGLPSFPLNVGPEGWDFSGPTEHQ